MKIDVVCVGAYQTNCYILRQNKEVLIIDPGDEFVKINEMVGQDQVVGILLTHRHFDHIGALDECLKEYQVPVFEYSNLEEKEYQVGHFKFNVLFTPGHTQDSVTYHFKDYGCLFTGDFIFLGSIGRTDLGGSDEAMKKSIQKLFHYQKEMTNEEHIYPGHGPSTTLEYELMHNPYLKISGYPWL